MQNAKKGQIAVFFIDDNLAINKKRLKSLLRDMIAAGATATLHFSVDVSAVPGSYTNSATATAAGFTVVGSGPTAPVTVTAPPTATADVSVSKTDSPDPVLVGGNLTYTLAIHNAGPDAAVGVVVSDSLPAGVTLRIPILPATTAIGDDQLPPWKRKTA